MFFINNLGGEISPPLNLVDLYEVDIYTYAGTIVPNECQSLEEVFYILESSLEDAQLVNITKIKDKL